MAPLVAGLLLSLTAGVARADYTRSSYYNDASCTQLNPNFDIVVAPSGCTAFKWASEVQLDGVSSSIQCMPGMAQYGVTIYNGTQCSGSVVNTGVVDLDPCEPTSTAGVWAKMVCVPGVYVIPTTGVAVVKSWVATFQCPDTPPDSVRVAVVGQCSSGRGFTCTADGATVVTTYSNISSSADGGFTCGGTVAEFKPNPAGCQLGTPVSYANSCSNATILPTVTARPFQPTVTARPFLPTVTARPFRPTVTARPSAVPVYAIDLAAVVAPVVVVGVVTLAAAMVLILRSRRPAV